MDLANKLKNQATYIGSLETEVQYQRNMDKQLTAQIQRVRELVDRLENKEAFHQLTAYACAEEILKALDGEIGSVEPVKLEALDGEQE
jgi:hypothetical protein